MFNTSAERKGGRFQNHRYERGIPVAALHLL